MAIPDYQTIMLPLLEFTQDEKEHTLREAIEFLADVFRLTKEERMELLPSGQEPRFDNRVGWARTYLKKAGMLETTRRGYFRITPRGINVLREKPPKITDEYLKRFPEFIEFLSPAKREMDHKEVNIINDKITQEESLETIFDRLKTELASEILGYLKECSPSFFEKIVVDVLLKMGYGGSRFDAGQAIGGSGDGGIDGIIKEDKLGLDVVYIQAKRWDTIVGRPEIQKFAGALQGQRAKKGIFITTSSFTKEAEDYAKMIESRIVLIDGQKLARYMIDNNVGVTVHKTFEIKKVDTDYFAED